MNNLVPGAVPFPGILANYGAGYTALAAVFWHYTVGTNSLLLIANNGLCAFLIAADGTIYQLAPWDAVTYTQCEFNRRGQGIEVESLDGTITVAQLASLRYLTLFLLNAGGSPHTFYDGPRLPVGFPVEGITNHRNLQHIACDQHVDGFDQWVADYVLAPDPTPEPEPVPVPPTPPDPNAGDDEMGIKIAKWKDAAGEHEDNLGVDAAGNLFTRYPRPDGTFPRFVIAGPAADGKRYRGPLEQAQVPAVVTTDGQLAGRVLAANGDVVEFHFNMGDPLDPPDTGSRWVAYPLAP